MTMMARNSTLSCVFGILVLPFLLLLLTTSTILAFAPFSTSSSSSSVCHLNGVVASRISSTDAAVAANTFATTASPLLPSSRRGLLPQRRQHLRRQRQCLTTSSSTTLFNLLDFIGLGSQDIEPETKLPYAPPLSLELSISDTTRTFAIMERPLSFTGEDFDIVELPTGDAGWNNNNNNKRDFVRVRGAMMHLPGKDKMNLMSSSDGKKCVIADRVWIAATPSYDILRGEDGDYEKIGWMEKRLIGFQDTFDVYMEGRGGFGITGLFKPTPAYRIVGDFLDRNFAFKNEEGKIVARANMDGWVQFDGMNHYQVRVASGMDALLVLACVCCIDEEFDEEHQKRRKER